MFTHGGIGFDILYAKSNIDKIFTLAHIFFVMQLARDPKQIGNIIRRARKKQGLTQSQLGDKAGLRQATVSQVENGLASARIETLLELFAALDLELCVAERSKDWSIEP